MGIVQQAAAYARGVYLASDWPHIVEVVTYARQLATETSADQEIVDLAAYFHDIASATMGPEEHHIKSAEVAREWLSQRGYPAEGVERVAAAIMAHMRPVMGPARESVALEGRLLYDADKLGRAQGFHLLRALVRLGAEVPWAKLTYEQLADAIREGREGTQEAYHTLYTNAARELARQGYEQAMAFSDHILHMQIFQVPPAA